MTKGRIEFREDGTFYFENIEFKGISLGQLVVGMQILGKHFAKEEEPVEKTEQRGREFI